MQPLRRLPLAAVAALALAARAPGAHADGNPIQLSLFTPIQIVQADQSVSGLRLDLIYGRNANVTGVDWGLVNHDTGSGKAWQLGAVNVVGENFTGWQDGYVNLTHGRFAGLQSGGFNRSESMTGFAYGLVNVTKDRSEEHTSELQSRLHLVC